jgi:hypothetical protein
LRTRTSRPVLMALALAMLSALSTSAVEPNNQCPGDCSPCLGPDDPFCSGTGSEGPGGGGGSSGDCWGCYWFDPGMGLTPSKACAPVADNDTGTTGCAEPPRRGRASPASCRSTSPRLRERQVSPRPPRRPSSVRCRSAGGAVRYRRALWTCVCAPGASSLTIGGESRSPGAASSTWASSSSSVAPRWSAGSRPLGSEASVSPM